MEAILILLGLFYLIVLPILVFVALGRPNELALRIQKLERRLEEVERHLRDGARATPDLRAAHQPPPVPAVPPPLPPTPAVTFPPPPIAAPALASAIPERRPVAPSRPKFYANPAPEQTPIEARDPGAEIRLGARWATRLGSGFLVVAVVFFGIYISKYSSPAIRLLEVAGLAAVVTGLGPWLERQAREFGEAIFAGGLAMFYFAAFAAQGITAMRVIPVEAVEAGLAVQFTAVAAVGLIAWARNRKHVAAMSIGLGVLSCFFALHRDRTEITLGAALGLVVAAAALRLARGWVWPLAIAYVGAQICYIATILALMGFTLENFFQGQWVGALLPRLAPELAPWPGVSLVFPLAYFLLLLGADTWAEMRGQKDNPVLRTGIILTGAILFGLGGWWGGAEFGQSWDSYNLLAAAVVCLGAGFVYRVRKDVPEIYEILYAAAGAWTAIYFINEYTGWIRWLALLLESFVFAWRVRRHGSGLAWSCLLGAWACSFAMAYADTFKIAPEAFAWSSLRLKYAVWPLVSLALWAWIEKSPRKTRDEEATALTAGGIFTAVGAVVLGRLAWADPAASWLLLAVALIAAAFGVVARLRVVWPTVWLTLLFSMWLYGPMPGTSDQEIFFALLAFSAAVLAATALLHHRAAAGGSRALALWAEILGFLSLLYTWMRGFDVLPGAATYFPLTLMFGSVGLALLAWRGPWRATGDLAWIWAMAALVAETVRSGEPASRGIEYACLASALVLGWVWGALARREKPGVYVLGLDRAGLLLPGILFTGWTVLAFPRNISPVHEAVLLAGSAVAFAVAARRIWLPGGATAAVLLSIGAAGLTLSTRLLTMNDCGTPALVSGAILFEGWLTVRRSPQWARGSRDIFIFIIASAALLVFDGPALSLPDPASRNITLLWAGAGGLIFVAGLAARFRSFRYAGLLWLALCVPRLFLVDITDQFGRILAFGALAIVLLAIGFSYHKLRPWLAGRDGPDAPPIIPPVKNTFR